MPSVGAGAKRGAVWPPPSSTATPNSAAAGRGDGGTPWRRPSQGAEGGVNITVKSVKKPDGAKPTAKPNLASAADPKPKSKVEIPATVTKGEKKMVKQPSIDVAPTRPKSKAAESTVPKAPPPPPAPPSIPPPPPLIPAPPPLLPERNPLPPSTLLRLEGLRKTPRKRPDWAAMMKEIEIGDKKRLKHVVTDDRSKPLLPSVKTTGKIQQFVYESEKPKPKDNHNQLLEEIQKGVRLKKVVTNDRSKPNLRGLRKLRRQVTVEGKLQRQTSTDAPDSPIAVKTTAPLAAAPSPAAVSDSESEEEDLDKLRDDLQSTKQMLAMEMRSKEKLEKDAKGMQSRVSSLEEEIALLRAQLQQQGIEPPQQEQKLNKSSKDKDAGKSSKEKNGTEPATKASKSTPAEASKPKRRSSELKLDDFDEIAQEMEQLKAKAEKADEWERKCKDVEKELAVVKATLDDTKHQSLLMQKRLDTVRKNKKKDGEVEVNCIACQTEDAASDSSSAISRPLDADDHVDADSESSSEEDIDLDAEVVEAAETEEEKAKKREARESQLMANKLRNLREREASARKERRNLKDQLKRLQDEVKTERGRYKELEKELMKMASMLKVNEADDEEEEEETESESSTEEEEEEESSTEEEDAAKQGKGKGLKEQVRRQENTVAAIKKGNCLLKANIDKLKEELAEERNKYRGLEEELGTLMSDVN